MGDDHCIRGVKLFLPLAIFTLAVGVLSFKEIDEDMFLFMTSRYVPPPPCPVNEIYKTCMGNCTDCEHRGLCPMDGCSRKGCDCIPNFVRLKPGGPCEHVHKCPVIECGDNEVFRECGPVCERCGTMRCRVLQCEHRCYCEEGYLREWEGKCVPQNECPPKLRCSRDEEKAEEGRVDEYCLHAEDEETSNATETREGCYCKEGYRRNALGRCRPESYCADIKCMNGEVYRSCPNMCNSTCRNYDDASCEEDGNCYPGCFCADGYLMNDYRRCVRLQDCPPGSNPFAPTVGPTTTPAMTESTTPASPSTTSNQATENYTSNDSTQRPVTSDDKDKDSSHPEKEEDEDANSSVSAAATTEETTDSSTEAVTDVTTSEAEAQSEDQVTSIAESQTAVESESQEESEVEEQLETTVQPTTTTQKPKPTKNAKTAKEIKDKIKMKKATTLPPEDDMDEDNE